MPTTHTEGNVEVHDDDRTPADDPARRKPAASPADVDPAHRETPPETEVDAAHPRATPRPRSAKKTPAVKAADAQRRTRVGKHKA